MKIANCNENTKEHKPDAPNSAPAVVTDDLHLWGSKQTDFEKLI
jgi:hypothetical protein